MNQENYQQMQMLDYQIKQLQKIVETVDSQLVEMSATVEALNEFEKLHNNDEILFPIANGIFARGKLSDNKTLKINIGSNVVVEKNVADTIIMLETQARDIEEYKAQVMAQLQKFIDMMNQMQGAQE